MDLKLNNIFILLIILSFTPMINLSQLYAENEIGLIDDKDGYTFIRKGPNINSKIIDTLWEGEFFQFKKTDSINWFKVYKIWNSNGYVHKSRIENIKTLPRKAQKHLIDSIFEKEKLCYYKKCDFKSKMPKYSFSDFHEEKFTPILDLFIFYSNNKFDSILFNKFLQIIILENGSADELPPTTLGFIFEKNPEITIKEILKYDNNHLNNSLLFGISNVIYENKESMEYLKLNDVLIKNGFKIK